MPIAAILLAAGESSRMGFPKPLLEWGGTTLVEYQISQLDQSGVDPLVVVLGSRAEEVLPAVQRAGARAVVNELYREGRASSLRAGAAALSEDIDAVVVLNVDQPRPQGVVARLVERQTLGKRLICVPAYRGHRGHPPVLAGSLLPELREVREATQGLRGVMERHAPEIEEVLFDSDVVLLDINTLEEYRRAREIFFGEVKS